ncbi:MAG: cytoplasmic protein [Desulfovibrio sp.]|nr:cytoplasmic protein [Desulfovibrio sp.]
MQEKKEKIVVYEFDPVNPPPLTEEQKARLDALAKMPDSEIDYSDIPPITDFTRFHRVSPRSSFVRIDGDILDWVQTLGDDRQALANDLLRRQMLAATANNV